MTKRHSRFVQALGNGNYLTVTILRLLGASGIVTVLGAMFWIGSTSAHLAESIKANTASIDRFISAQQQRDGRQDQRIETILKHLMSKP